MTAAHIEHLHPRDLDGRFTTKTNGEADGGPSALDAAPIDTHHIDGLGDSDYRLPRKITEAKARSLRYVSVALQNELQRAKAAGHLPANLTYLPSGGGPTIGAPAHMTVKVRGLRDEQISDSPLGDFNVSVADDIATAHLHEDAAELSDRLTAILGRLCPGYRTTVQLEIEKVAVRSRF